MNKYISMIGIILVMAGTTLSLWSVLGTRVKDVGTAEKEDHKQEDFEKDKKKVVIGITLIFIGSILQIVGLFL